MSRTKNVMKKRVAKISDYKNTFNSQQGRRVLADMLAENKCLSTSFVKEDPYLTAFNEGQRNVVLRILTILQVDTTQLLKLIEETDNASKMVD